jgi:hypothetical protein
LEALDRIKWRNHFGRGFGPVVSQITDDDERGLIEIRNITFFKSHAIYSNIYQLDYYIVFCIVKPLIRLVILCSTPW